MLTITFLIIAHLMRHRYITPDTPLWGKLIYYAFSVWLTPLFGPRFFKWCLEDDHSDPGKPTRIVFPAVD